MNKQIIHTVVENQAMLTPDRIAIEEESRKITYQQLNNNASAFARQLSGLGLRKDAIAGVVLSPGSGLITSLLAIWKSGGVYMPIDLGSGKKRLMEILKQIPFTLLITESKYQDACMDLLKEAGIAPATMLVVFDKLEILQYQDGNYKKITCTVDEHQPLPTVEPTDSNYIFYTSGSTGTGKAILGDHKGLAHFLAWEKRELAMDCTCRVSQVMSITFDGSLRDFFLPLSTGGTLCIPAEDVRSNPARLVEWIAENKISLLHCVPSLFRLLTREIAALKEKLDLSSLRYIVMAGEPLFGKDIIAWFDAAGDNTELVTMYGTSETTLAKTFHRISSRPENASRVVHVGQPIDDTFIAIINNNELCKIGEMGEVYIKTPFMTKGYFNNPEQTASVFVQNPLTKETDIVYKTGDLGKYLKDRSVEIIGRIDDQVKVNGIRIEPKEIEQAALGFADVDHVFVNASKNKEGQNELICYYIGDAEEEALRSYLQHQLPLNIIPSYFVKMSEFPLTLNGKIDKKALPKPQDWVKKQFTYESPVDELEKGLEKIWSQILGVEQIGRKTSFFEIGGNSLRALQIVSRIYKEYNVLVKMDVIFTHRTIEQQASFIRTSKQQALKDIQLLVPREHYELSNSQKRLWILSQTEEEKALYNVPEAYLFEGKLEVPAFYKALTHIVERHEILRTSFLLIDGEPRQKIRDFSADGFNIKFIDLRGDIDKEKKAAAIISEESNNVFDLEQGPLYNPVLIQLNDEKYMFLFVMHHIISDAWTMEVLTNEVFELYTAFTQGNPNPLKPLRIQYKEYAAWQNAQLGTEDYNGHKAFWQQQFSRKVPALQLPTDYQRPAYRTYESDTLSFTANKDVKRAVEQLVSKTHSTAFSAFVALINLVLYKYTQQNEIVIGSPVAGRDHPDLENQVGYYVNTVPIKITVNASDRFSDFLVNVRNHVVEVLKHQLYPFDQIVDDLTYELDRNRNPLFDVGFTYFKESPLYFDQKARSLADVEVRHINSGFSLVKADFWIKVMDMEDGYIVDLAYNTNLFAPNVIRQLLTDMQVMLEALLQAPETTIEQLVSLADQHQEQQLKERNKAIKSKNLDALKKVIQEITA